MDILGEVTVELRESIGKNYNNESYSEAIKDAIIFLSDVIRNKTGLEGDGASLIGNAFGGNNPKIKLNNLQTDSEKNIQKGMQELLRGIYSAIRNPRNHDKINDDKEDADAIILFINYLMKTIDKSKLSFEIDSYLRRVFDEHYVVSEEYSNLIVKEIPKRQRTDIAIRVLLKRKEGKIEALSSFVHALCKLLSEEELEILYEVVSEELKYEVDHLDIRTILGIFPGKYWCKVERSVKLRIENILLEDLKKGEYDKDWDECGKFGALATWLAPDHIMRFEESVYVNRAIYSKLESKNHAEVEYINRYFWGNWCDANKNDIDFWLRTYFSEAFKNNDLEIIKKLEQQIAHEEDHPWWEVFKEELENYPEIKYIEFPF